MIAHLSFLYWVPYLLVKFSFLNDVPVANSFLMKPRTITTKCIISPRNKYDRTSFGSQTIPIDICHNFMLRGYSQKDSSEFANESTKETNLKFNSKPQPIEFPNKSSNLVDREKQIQSALEIVYKEGELKNNSKDDSSIPVKADSSSQVPLSENIILLLGSGSIAIILSKALSSFELLQDWRKGWCLIGCLYIWDSLQSIPMLVPSKFKVFNIFELLCGIGLLIGGAYDLFMPVYMTGPNVFTSAGIHQDSATVLLGLSLYTFSTTGSNLSPKIPLSVALNNMGSYDRKLLQMFLLAQLYILGESSIDELISYFT